MKLDTPWSKLARSVREVILGGSGDEEIEFCYTRNKSRYTYTEPFEGVLANLERRYHETTSDDVRGSLEEYMNSQPCPECGGSRLTKEALFVRVAGRSIWDIVRLSIQEAEEFFVNLKLDKPRTEIARRILKEITERLGFLTNVGLGYITLDRSGATLSGGEGQRIRLATQIGSSLVGVLYILDEPSIGLHQRDNRKLLDALKRLRDMGNSVLVVEHDEETIRNADHVIDMGPGAGEGGGEVVAEGTLANICKVKRSLTGKYMTGELKIPVPQIRKKPGKKSLKFSGLTENNLKKITVNIPIGLITCVTGVSGSGKSSLVIDTIYRNLARRLYRAREHAGHVGRITGLGFIDKGNSDRPVADRKDPALKPGHLYRRIHPGPRAFQPAPGLEGARLRPRALQLQHTGRQMRVMQGRRADKGRDALSARRIRDVRGVFGRALQPRHARDTLPRQEHLRMPGDDRHGGRFASSIRSPISRRSSRPSPRSGSATSGSASPPRRSRAARRKG